MTPEEFKKLPLDKQVDFVYYEANGKDFFDLLDIGKLDSSDILMLALDDFSNYEKLDPGVFDSSDWARLLARYGDEAVDGFEGCYPWDCFDGDCWADILIAEPDFAIHCEDWSKLAPRDWNRLLEKRPELAKYRPAEKI